MRNKFFKKIIARSSDDLQFISAYCSNSSIKINNIKYLKKNKIFLILLERVNQDKKNQKISSILKFEFIDSSKSKNINQKDDKILLKLIAIKLFKVKKVSILGKYYYFFFINSVLFIFIAIHVISSLNFSAPQSSFFSIDSTIFLGVTFSILSIIF